MAATPEPSYLTRHTLEILGYVPFEMGVAISRPVSVDPTFDAGRVMPASGVIALRHALGYLAVYPTK